MDKGLGNVGLPSLFGVRLSPVTGADGKTRWGIPMQAEAVMRMQSPVLAEGLPSKATVEQGQDKNGNFPESTEDVDSLKPLAAPDIGDYTPPPDPEFCVH